MLDRSAFWTLPGDRLDLPGLTVQALPAQPQTLVSGDLDGFLSARGLPPAIGLLGPAQGEVAAIRLARHRMLVLGLDTPPEAPAWVQGCALTPMTAGLAVLDITGPRAMEWAARGTAIDLRHPSPSAALLFAGIPAILYRRDAALRLHIDRSLLAYVLDWTGAALPQEP